MKKTIVKKLFIITSIFLLSLIVGTMLFQSLFFQNFYLNRKMKNLEKDVVSFRLAYSFDISNNYALFNSMQLFEQKNNAKIAIYSDKGEVKFLANPDKQIDPKILKTLNSIYLQIMQDSNYAENIFKSNEILTTVINDKEFTTKNIVCVAPISINSKYDNLIIAISPFQTIEEASSVIREFYVYIFIAAFFIIFILSFIYSNMLSKPLIKLNTTAKKMSNMDFSEKCSVTSEDEIGNLAQTLNFLSDNLHSALTELKISNEKLKDDIEKERKLEKMRKEFIAGVSHELKTPISIIEGYAEGLKDNIVEGEAKDFYIDVIIDETKKMTSLVYDMLDLSQMESGNYKLNKEVLDIMELIKLIVKKHINFVKDKEIDIHIALQEKFLVVGDKLRLEQVITNYLTNAIRYTPQKGFIKIYSIVKNDNIYIYFQNSGSFIPEKDLNNIWDKFYKIDKSRNRDMGGTGLGLAIVKNILTLHNSDFGVRNVEDGVEFYFSLKKCSEV
ncbi:ATP-binding protein [Desnuesiella massiliensis]|uniref:sensor histidine kinase n=1 Tax=Desnuesiella massiliensis TaxID=1650662 RepID=UPI0006E27D1B|nr:ATP-binding protein [Desnuesiella massiliensis]